MGSHLLQKAAARRLSVAQVLAMSDDEALALFRQLRSGEGEQVVCPHCGMAHRHYFRPTRKIWRCAGCQDDFRSRPERSSPSTSSPCGCTSRRRAFSLTLSRAFLRCRWARGLGVQQKTAYVFLHEIPESLLVGRRSSPMPRSGPRSSMPRKPARPVRAGNGPTPARSPVSTRRSLTHIWLTSSK
jgi:ribosomal protein L37AE/L43A